MEPTTTTRLLHAPQDADERQLTALTQLNGMDVPPTSGSRLPGSNLAQWKQERLAHHHAYFALLIKVFGRWKHVMEQRKRRRQRVIAACRVGAKFFQRLFWEQWKERVKHRREARVDTVERLQRVQEQGRLRYSLWRWRRLVAGSQQAQAREKVTVVSAARLAAEQRLEVRGVSLRGDFPTDQERRAPRPKPTIPSNVVAPHGLQGQRQKKLRQIIVFHTQRQYFQLWKQAASSLEKAIAKHLRAHTADRFRVHSAWKRWRRGFTARSEDTSASRRAAFFLYYQLTKSSISRLKTHAKRQRRERGVSVIIEARVRRHTLATVVGLWRQRLNTKLIFTHWRETVTADQHHKRDPEHLQAVRDAVSRLSKERVLRQFFSLWLEMSTRKQKAQALAKVLDGPVLQGLIREGFEIWRQQTMKRRRIQKLIDGRRRDQVAGVWRAWFQVTATKQRQEQQRRRAARFWYHNTLRKGFSALKGLRERRDKFEDTAEQTLELRKRRHTRTIFQQWREWSRSRCRHRQQYAQAMEHHKVTTARLAFAALRENVSQSRSRQDAARELAAKAVLHELRLVFKTWKAHYEHERARHQDLISRLASYHSARVLRVKRGCFQALDEHARSRATRRLVNAHARGHHQATLLRRAFTLWNSAVAQLKWEHIFNRRAQRFRDKQLKMKCFQLWKNHAETLQRHRQQTKLALHHWKKVREKHAFDAWKQYVIGKTRQKARIHAALEFRNRAHIRDGLTHWITGAVHLAEQRSRRTVEMQATHTARVWVKVRDIALHWRWLTHQSKLRDGAREVINRGNAAFGTLSDEDHMTHQGGYRRLPAAPAQARSTRRATDRVDHGPHVPDPQSALSEFVMLPRNRPRPRKPVEVILDREESIQCDSSNNTTTVYTLHGLNTRYGFHFPTLEPTGTARVEAKQRTRQPSIDRGSTIAEESKEAVVMYEGWTVDELEKRLLYWHDRRQRLKALQQSLEDFRLLLQQASNEGNFPAHDLQHMKSRLYAMEQHEAGSRHQWNESRPEIQTLAERIKLMRSMATTA